MENHNSVVVKNNEGYETHISTGEHVIISDERVSSGGTNAGPTPYDLLMGALGSCIAITLRMYAEKKEIALHGITVRLDHNRVHAKDCDECETEEGHITAIDVKLSFTGNLTEEQKKRLLEISEMCPIHRALTSEIVIKSELDE